MSDLLVEPEPKYARRGANPTLETMEYVIGVLRNSEEPVSRNRVLSVLSGWGHSTTRQSLNAALAFFGDQGMIAEGSKGLIWVPEASPELLAAVRNGKTL
jgi:hypothetical protein